MTVKDSGRREDFPTGSRRDTRQGKGRFDLLPFRALWRVARHFEAGALKYGDRNWERGQPLSRYADSAMRHYAEFMIGQTDEDHLAAAAWNLLCLIDTEERIQAGLLPQTLNDLPPHPQHDNDCNLRHRNDSFMRRLWRDLMRRCAALRG